MTLPRSESVQPTTLIGVIAIFSAAACWGMSGIFVKLIVSSGSISPLFLAFWRDATAFLAFYLIAMTFEGSIKVSPPTWPWLIAMGTTLGGFHVVLNMGYLLNGAAITTIQQSAMPAIVLVIARIIWKEPLNRLKIVSLLLIGIGIFFVSGILQATAPNVTFGGILVGFCVPMFYAGWSLFGKKLRAECSAVVTLTWAFGIAAMLLLPFQVVAGGLQPPPLSAQTFLYFTGLIAISTVGAFFSYIFALGRLAAGVAAILVMSEIAFAVLYARLFLSEVLSTIEIGGALLIVTGAVFLAIPKIDSK